MINDVFTFIFLAEMLLKFAAWGLRQYFSDYWNQLDFVLVVSSIVGFVVEIALTSGKFPFNPSVFRIVRVARLTRALKSIRMVRRFKGVAQLVDTLIIAIPAMANVASLCVLIIFIFAVMGMDFFGSDEIQGEDAAYVNGMYNEYANFRYFGDAFTLLFRAVTGEAWNGIMHDMMVAHCDMQMYPDKHRYKPDDPEYDERWCGAPHPDSPWIFFVLFQVFVTGLLFELVTAIVLDESSKMNENEKLPVNSDMISNFNDHWAQLDPKATQMIPQSKVKRFLLSVVPPIFESEQEASAALFKMNIAAHQERGVLMVHYVDTLVAVVRFEYVKHLGEDVGRTLDLTMMQVPELTTRIVSAYPHLRKIEEMSPTDFKKELAAATFQASFLGKRARARAAARKRQLQVRVAELRRRRRGEKEAQEGGGGDGGGDGGDNGEGVVVPEEVERLSVVEMREELRREKKRRDEGGGGSVM